jgi:SagB-type dehydrogenase family enzyme
MVKSVAAAVGAAMMLAAPGSASPAAVKLPAAATDGGVGVQKALATRRSVRSFEATPLTLAQLSQLCWAAQGITDAKGHRTAPSARATYPLELYAMVGTVEGLAAGFYQYLPATHELKLLKAGDERARLIKEGVGQRWIESAPVIFAVVASPEGLAKLNKVGGNHGERLAAIEAGLVSENFFLQAVSLGLGSTYVAGYEEAAVSKVLGLPQGSLVFAILPVGRPRSEGS